jgi:hypothetical protein
MREDDSSSISLTKPALGLTETNESAVPSHLTVIEPPSELY